ncbi:MAG: hypothetical protein R3Y68_06710 [Rikenellaceae bacterium]
MKKLLYITYLALAMFGVGCEQESAVFEDSSNYSDFAFISTLGNEDDKRKLGVEVGETVSFMDLSRNPVSHEWIIPEWSLTLLRPGFNSLTTDYSEFAIYGETSTTDANAYVLTEEPGMVEVIIKNSYLYPVSFYQEVYDLDYPGNWRPEPLESTYDEETKLYNIEYVVSFEIFDKLYIDYMIYLNGDRDNPIYWWSKGDSVEEITTLDVDLADQITLEVMVHHGQATTKKWLFEGSPTIIVDGTDLSTIQYKAVGVYDVGSYSMVRKSSYNPAMPDGSAIQIIPVKFNVTDSSQLID